MLRSAIPAAKALSHVVVSSDRYAYCVDSQYSSTREAASDSHGFAHDAGVRATVTTGHACSNVVSG